MASLSELFSALGGALGLWLGVGMMQIIEHSFAFGRLVLTVKHFTKKKNKNYYVVKNIS